MFVYLGHRLMENRNGMEVDVQVALAMAKRLDEAKRVTPGTDKDDDAKAFAAVLRGLNI